MNSNKKKTKSHFAVLQRQLVRRRLWMLAAIILYMILYYPVATIMLIARSNESAAMSQMTAAQTLSQRLYEVGSWIGTRQSFTWIICLIGAVVAIQGYSYLFSMEQQDFYESQPVSRMERFWNIYANGFLMFELPLIVCTFLAIVCAVLMKGMNGITFLDAMVQLVRVSVIYAGSYSMGILAVMLTGNLIVAGIVSALLLGMDQAILLLAKCLTSTFYLTYSYLSNMDPVFMFSPLYNSQAPARWMSDYGYSWNYTPITAKALRSILSACLVPDLATLVIGAVVLLVSICLYQKRRQEYAGKTVIHRPVRAVIRVLCSVTAGLFAGEIVSTLFNSVVSRTGTVFMLVAIIVAAALCAGVIQMIYELDLWKFFNHFGEIAAAALAAAGIFLVFRYDLTGFDSYLPNPENVASASIYVYGDCSYDYSTGEEDNDSYVDNTRTVLDRMNMTDIEALEKIVEPAMANTRSTRNGSGATSWSAQVCYKMKNGRKVYRSIEIPTSTDAAAMDAVIGSQEYKEGLIPAYTDTYVQELTRSYGMLYYTNGLTSSTGSATLYTEFEKAYCKDLDEHYSYTTLSTEEAVGKVILRINQSGIYITQEYAVYPSYSNTLAFLAKYDMSLSAPSADQVSYAAVSRYDENSSSQVEYTDQDKIQEILNNSAVILSSDWKNISDNYDQNVDLQVTANSVDLNIGYYSTYYFRKGQIPDFVTEDLDDAQVE